VRNHSGIPTLIEESVLARLQAGLSYASWLLDRIDATRRLTHLAIACGALSPASRLPGWRRSVDRTSLQLNSLLTGNFTGKITISGLKAAVLEQETAVPQRLFSKFPSGSSRNTAHNFKRFAKTCETPC
jgi:hypothetical protein